MTTIKRAVLIGINYKNDRGGRLEGAINDVTNMRNYLLSTNHFKRDEIFTMTDDTTGQAYPTRNNIMARLNRLVNVANRHNTVEIDYFIMYSGHGKINNGDQVIVPIDHASSGYITDKTLTSEFVQKLPSNVKLFMMMDTCNSETMLDLRYGYPLTGINNVVTRESYPETSAYVILLSASKDNQIASEVGFDQGGNIVRKINSKVVYDVINSSKIYYVNTNRISTCPFSMAESLAERACRNSSAVLPDTGGGGCNASAVLLDVGPGQCIEIPIQDITYSGVLTTAFLDTYRDNMSYAQVVRNIRDWTRVRGLSQVAQLSSGTLIDPNTSTKMIK